MGHQLAPKSAQALFELSRGELLTEHVENVVGIFPGTAESTKLASKDGVVERDGLVTPLVANGGVASISTLALSSIVPIRNSMEDRCPSPIARTLITKRKLLVGRPV